MKSIFKFCLNSRKSGMANIKRLIGSAKYGHHRSLPTRTHLYTSIHTTHFLWKRAHGKRRHMGMIHLGESCTQNIKTVCFLSLHPCHHFSTRRNHLLLWLWHLKSFLYIAGDCSCVGGFSGCSVVFKEKRKEKEKERVFRRNILRDWNIALSYRNCSVALFTNTLKHWATDGIQ